MERIALGLGLTTEELLHAEDTVLLRDHPAIRHSMSSAEAETALSSWYATRTPVHSGRNPRHRSDEERFERRQEVRQAMLDGRFCLEFVRDAAERHGVSHSQIYADRSFLKRTEGVQTPDD